MIPCRWGTTFVVVGVLALGISIVACSQSEPDVTGPTVTVYASPT